MFCIRCGQKAENEQAEFCARCGHRLFKGSGGHTLPQASHINASQPLMTPIEPQTVSKATGKRSFGLWAGVVALMIIVAALLWVTTQKKDHEEASDEPDSLLSESTVHLSIPVGNDGMNQWGNLSENLANGGLVAYQGNWTFFSDPSADGVLCAVSGDGQYYKLTGVPAANINVMGDTLVYTDLFGTLFMHYGENGEQSYRYPGNDLTLPSMLNDVGEDEQIVFGGYLMAITGIEEFMATGDVGVLHHSFLDMDGAVCYYPVMTKNGLLVSCLKDGMMPDEVSLLPSLKGTPLKAVYPPGIQIGTDSRIQTLGAGTGFAPGLFTAFAAPSYELLRDNGFLYLARVERDPDGDPQEPFKSVEYLTRIGDEKTQKTGASPIIVEDDAIYVEVYQEPDSTENGNWQQPALVALDPKDYHQLSKTTGSFPQNRGEEIYFLDDKGRLNVLNGHDGVPEVISDGPAVSSFDILANGDIVFTYYTDDSREVRQGIISKNAFNEAYSDAELGSGSRSAKHGWYTHMNVLDGMLEDDVLASMNRSYYTDKDTFLLKKDEKGYWGWYRMIKNKEGTFEFIPQKTMRLPDDKQQENALNPGTEETEATPTPEPSPDPAPESTKPEKAAIPMDNAAMDLIYDRMIPESDQPVKSQEEMDKLWVMELSGKGSYKVIENGYTDYDAYIAGQREKFDAQFASFSASERESIYASYAEMEQELDGKTGDLSLDTNAMPGLEYLDIESSPTGEVKRKVPIPDGEIKVSLAISGMDLRISALKKETEYLILKTTHAYAASVVDGSVCVAIRYHVFYHTDGSMVMKGFLSQVNLKTTVYTVYEFECEVTDSNIV